MGLGEAGATVVPTGRRQELADEVATAIKSLGRETLSYPVDVADRSSIDKLRDAVLQRFGFEHGRIMEPACGLGHFIGVIPDEMHSR